jgi:hypothetical protein
MQRAKELKVEEEALANAANVRQISEQMRASVRTVECPMCGDETCELEGIYCPAQQHFVCDECFAQHVEVQCTPADDFIPYEAGEIWCLNKPIAGDTGCGSHRPFTPKVCPPPLSHIVCTSVPVSCCCVLK